MTPARKKYLRKVWRILWLSNWTAGKQLDILDRLISNRRPPRQVLK